MFICAAHKQLAPQLNEFNRLYAFPTVPDLDGQHKIILDSGAFGLSKSGRKMDAQYLNDLALHYQKYGQQKNVFCIAPDVFKNSHQSIRQYKDFTQRYPNIKVVPVLQFQTKNIDLFNAKKQIDEYSRLSNSGMICVSNNKFNPVKQFDELQYIVKKIRHKFKHVWIHVLGAGYSHNNVKDWLKTGVDSIDSISYYTDAQAKLQWLRDSYQTHPSPLEFKQLALHNAEVANEILY